VSYLNSLKVGGRRDDSAGSRVSEALNRLRLPAIRCSSLTACLRSISEMNLRVVKSVWLVKAKLAKSATQAKYAGSNYVRY
jgi:hypothetical protein